MNRNRLFAMSIVILLSTAGSVFAVKQPDTLKSKMPVDSIATGKGLYERSCQRCHKLKDPAKYTVVQWPGLVNKMQKRAKITDTEKAIILTYLKSQAKK